jgi:hypothetical protein
MGKHLTVRVNYKKNSFEIPFLKKFLFNLRKCIQPPGNVLSSTLKLTSINYKSSKEFTLTNIIPDQGLHTTELNRMNNRRQ